MFMRRASALITAAALALTLFAGTAFAEETTPPTTPAVTVPPPPVWLGDLKLKIDQVTALKGQIQAQEAELKAKSQANKALFDQLRAATTGGLEQQVKELKAQLKAAFEATVKPYQDQIKALEAQVQAAQEAKDVATAWVLRAQMAGLRAQAIQARQALPQVEQLKALEAQLKAKREAFAAIKGQVEALLAQEKALYEANHQLNTAGKALWQSLETQVKAMDQTAIFATLDQLIANKQQVIDNLQQISAIKTQVNTVLQNALNVINS